LLRQPCAEVKTTSTYIHATGCIQASVDIRSASLVIATSECAD
jgi:hypothetical protein